MFENEIITISEFLDPRFFVEYFVYHLRELSMKKVFRYWDSTLRKYEIGVQKKWDFMRQHSYSFYQIQKQLNKYLIYNRKTS